MSTWEVEDDSLALFLEAHLSDKEPEKIDKNEGEEGPSQKRPCMEVESNVAKKRKLSRFHSSIQVRNRPSSRSKRARCNSSGYHVKGGIHNSGVKPKRADNSFLSKVPPEVFHDILKFLSSEDLVSCSQVCRYLSFVASDETLWRHLYCMRWGLLRPKSKYCDCAWKKLYLQRDEEEMVHYVRNCPSESKAYYIQMQTAKRCQAPIPSQDDSMILDKTVADEVSTWKSSKGLTDQVVTDHACSGKDCSYHQIGDVFVCEKTGNIHVCDDSCKDASADLTNGLVVCTISGHCFERLMSPTDEVDQDTDQQQDAVSDEAEPFMGSGLYARAYSLGYNCADEKELEACLQFC
ncbi:F-box protein SKIP31 [Heracleum sosnowskyi]|uniref:F-box protein SKIP31 n=1 Tax=Heracleum sosnowskyi TaxID=360622 RepID=A0AAD8HUQ5_9APIA|nr:F-box protein SKIP31 [Heracleum sosnowskyi]